MAQTDIGGTGRASESAAPGSGAEITRTHYMLVITTIGAAIIVVVAALFTSLF